MVENSSKSRTTQRVSASERDAVTLKIVALEFVEAINSGDPERLIALQTEDFAFIDMSGDMEHGQQGWSDYFSAHPEYKIHVQHVLTGSRGVAIIGRTSGSHIPPDVEAEETVLWTAEIENGRVSEWRIYTDVEEARKRVLEED
jgi:ketosteroid isomerase-like protein